MSGDPEGALGDWLAANWPRSSHPEDQPFTLAVRLLALAPSERAELLNLTARIAAASPVTAETNNAEEAK